jgi:hypothetical protein
VDTPPGSAWESDFEDDEDTKKITKTYIRENGQPRTKHSFARL